jgi:hypothetical protein
MHSYRVSKLKRGPGYCRIMDRRWITARVLLWVVPRALPGRLVSTTGTAVVRATIGDTSSLGQNSETDGNNTITNATPTTGEFTNF